MSCGVALQQSLPDFNPRGQKTRSERLGEVIHTDVCGKETRNRKRGV